MIIKFQSGGTAPFVSYTPLNFNTASNYDSSDIEDTRKTKSSDSKESGKLTEKDLLMAIKDLDALPSDSAQLYDQMVDFVRMQEMGFGDPSMLATQFIRMQQHMKDSVYRKKTFEEAYNNVKENNGLNEYAVTDTGDIVVASNDGGIKFASIEQVLSGEYRPLTNSDLLRLRAESYAGNDTLTQIVSNGIGMEKIVQLINQAMKSVGSSQETYEGLSKDPFQQATVEAMRELQNKINIINSSSSSDEEKQKAISELQAATQASLSQRYAGVTEQGLYKYTESSKNSNEQLKYALNYIYNVLPKNARTILDLHSGGNGKKMIGNLLVSTVNTEHSLKWDMLENDDGTKPGTKESSDSQSRSLDPVTGFIAGMGYQEQAKINIGNSISFVVNGRYSSLVDKSGNPLKPNSTLLDVLGSAFQGVLDTRFLYMGDQLIDGDRTKVLIDDANIIRVDLPVNKELKKKGIISPDLSLSQKIEGAEFDIKTKNITDEEEINEVYRDHELPDKYIKTNKGWNLNQYDWTSFAMIAASAEESAFSDPDSVTLPEITNEGKKNEIINTLKQNDKDYSTGFWGTDFYHGYVFIPIKDDYVAASYSSGNYMKVPGNNAIDIAEKQALQQQYVKPVDVRK